MNAELRYSMAPVMFSNSNVRGSVIHTACFLHSVEEEEAEYKEKLDDSGT